jgi:hypothetical protein
MLFKKKKKFGIRRQYQVQVIHSNREVMQTLCQKSFNDLLTANNILYPILKLFNFHKSLTTPCDLSKVGEDEITVTIESEQDA